MAKNQYYVYVTSLEPEFASTKKAKNNNPDGIPGKPCIYVGYSSKTPEIRLKEHMEGKRNKRGPLFSRIVYNYGTGYLHRK